MHIQPLASGHDLPCVPLPFNCKCLTTEQIKRVGRLLMVSTEVAATEVHVMIETKLRELRHKPKNVQALVSASGTSLLEEGEEFMSILVGSEGDQPLKDPGKNEGGGSKHNESSHKVEQLRTELQDTRAEFETLNATVITLEIQVEEGKDRVKRL